ncbi:hypothetical protein [Dyella tabacisoli]|uniref:Uncharacterized protein n=1 Tax=Dyella tabacisoli TaxID=2282381 RepID=A0A369UMB8_9GAMM|nr:hypothetical protein [Dyella tabacisoli]RDD81902.1 hypothetical protein DVJ77_08895 [Dyella tabacisoli]
MPTLRSTIFGLVLLPIASLASETTPSVSLTQLSQLYSQASHVTPVSYLDQRVTIRAVVAKVSQDKHGKLLVHLIDEAGHVEGRATFEPVFASKAKTLQQGQPFKAACTIEFSTNEPITLGDCQL